MDIGNNTARITLLFNIIILNMSKTALELLFKYNSLVGELLSGIKGLVLSKGKQTEKFPDGFISFKNPYQILNVRYLGSDRFTMYGIGITSEGLKFVGENETECVYVQWSEDEVCFKYKDSLGCASETQIEATELINILHYVELYNDEKVIFSGVTLNSEMTDEDFDHDDLYHGNVIRHAKVTNLLLHLLYDDKELGGGYLRRKLKSPVEINVVGAEFTREDRSFDGNLFVYTIKAGYVGLDGELFDEFGNMILSKDSIGNEYSLRDYSDGCELLVMVPGSEMEKVMNAVLTDGKDEEDDEIDE